MGVDKYDSENVANMFEQLEKRIRTYNNDYGEGGGRAFIQRYEKQPEKATWETSNQPLVFVICTLMMPRIHKLVRQAGELVYCDSTSSLDRYNCPTLTVMSTCTSAGSILLGVV